jgi:dephospho-CoA kinase
MKYITVLLNGSGTSGKDTFVECLQEQMFPVMKTSIVDPTKKVAIDLGWNGKKTDKDRKFLCDLKSVLDEYSDYNYQKTKEKYNKYIELLNNSKKKVAIIVIDMREHKDISRWMKEHLYQNVYSVLVKRDSVEQIHSNHADAGVLDVEYDYIIDNNGNLDTLRQSAKTFVDDIFSVKEHEDHY